MNTRNKNSDPDKKTSHQYDFDAHKNDQKADKHISPPTNHATTDVSLPQEETYEHSPLDALVDESIFIIREGASSFLSPTMLFSAGKDSIVMAHLAMKAFAPYPVPFPFLHIDTGVKFPEMYQFRDRFIKDNNLTLHIFQNTKAIKENMNPHTFGTDVCCGALKTNALLNALSHYQNDAAFGGARREEEKSRAKERIMSLRTPQGTWISNKQRPEFWDIYNTKLRPQESMRIFPLSNWTELDVWTYIQKENIEVPALYFAKERLVIKNNKTLLPVLSSSPPSHAQKVMCRFRTLGCHPCTGAVPSYAQSVEDIINEIKNSRYSERQNRLIDSHNGMEDKKNKGYF